MPPERTSRSRRSIRTPFGERLGLDVPILGFSHEVQVAAALSEAGGLGVYGIAHDTPDELPAKLAALGEAHGERPTAIDIMMPAGMPEGKTLDQVRAGLPDEHRAFVAELAERYEVPPATESTFFNSVLRTPAYFEGQLEAVLDSDVDVVAFGVGLTRDAVDRLKDAGKLVGALVGAVHHVDRYANLGLDFLVAQGAEAGGHTGSVGTMVLVPEVVQRAGDTPVLAAGGIGHGSQIAAAMAMGAQGVWLGTAWLGTREHAQGDHAVSDLVRAKLFAAGSGDTVVTKGSSGKPQRQIRSRWSDEWNGPDAPPALGMPYQHALVGDLMVAVEEHQVEPLLYSGAGQGVGWMSKLESVAEVVDRLVDEAITALDATNQVRIDR